MDLSTIRETAKKYEVPVEDVLFIAINLNGVDFDCDYNRMRTPFRLADKNIFQYAKNRDELNYYLALPIIKNSPFKIIGNILWLRDEIIGEAEDPKEDICDSHYPRRKGTSLNINPNTRTSCHGCKFCYSDYQVPHDRKQLRTENDLRQFFQNWIAGQGVNDLSHLIQVSVVTGCYENGNELCDFLLKLKKVLSDYYFQGKIFYLGSQLDTKEKLNRIKEIKPVGVCFSIENFERRNILKKEKRANDLDNLRYCMDIAIQLGYEINFSYILGLESLQIVDYYFDKFKFYINKFPTINILQMHKNFPNTLITEGGDSLEYYLKARRKIENIFADTDMRPLIWEDYRGLWYLTFNGEPLKGVRFPY